MWMYIAPPDLTEGEELEPSNPSVKKVVFTFLFDKVLFFFNDSIIL